MIRLVTYDINDDRIRLRVANHLLAIGFERVQKSVFLGDVKLKSLRAFMATTRPKLKPGDKLFAIPLTKKQVREMEAIGLEHDRDMLLGEVKVLVV